MAQSDEHYRWHVEGVGMFSWAGDVSVFLNL